MNLRVKGAEDVWAIGDVSALEWNQYLAGRAQALYLSKNFGLILRGKVPAVYKISTSLQIGKKTGMGHFGEWKMPTFMINFSRKNLFTENIGPLVDRSLSSWL